VTADAAGRFLVTAFFAVVFLQSAFDKLIDRTGNVAYFSDHFKDTPMLADSVPLLFWVLTAIELSTGILCALGILTGDFLWRRFGMAGAGVLLAGIALLCLLVGQRLAKDYAGAATVAAYLVVALVGLGFF